MLVTNNAKANINENHFLIFLFLLIIFSPFLLFVLRLTIFYTKSPPLFAAYFIVFFYKFLLIFILSNTYSVTLSVFFTISFFHPIFPHPIFLKYRQKNTFKCLVYRHLNVYIKSTPPYYHP